ncbi:VOC family protein [Virgibacillus necropolis]|nr:VOC family protein [Virgibacillus necropolis]
MKRTQGDTILDEQLAFDWGNIAVFLDPDGNRIELNETSVSHQ